MTDQLLTREQVAAATGLTLQTIKTYRRDGLMPKEDVKYGPTPLWKESTIKRWRGIK